MQNLLKILIPDWLWNRLRLKRILKSHNSIASYCDRIISEYEAGNIDHLKFSPKNDLDTKVLWQYWGQGFDAALPAVVRSCIDSIDYYAEANGLKVIRLDDSNVLDFIDIPDFVMQKYESGNLTRTHFSDILRLMLLKTYGGIWADATILLTGPIPDSILNQPFFVYQRDDEEPNKKYWESTYAYYFGWHPDFKVRMLNSFIVAEKGNRLVGDLLQMLLYYWKTNDTLIDYFLFQILFCQYVKIHPEMNCSIVSDTIPHMLQTKMTGECDLFSVDEILTTTAIHKLSTKVVNEPFLKSICGTLS